jgi:hypothetical protein
MFLRRAMGVAVILCLEATSLAMRSVGKTSRVLATTTTNATVPAATIKISATFNSSPTCTHIANASTQGKQKNRRNAKSMRIYIRERFTMEANLRTTKANGGLASAALKVE